jgi:Zn-dependent protease with chaperone function
LPNLFLRSAGLLAVLYGLVTLLLITLVELGYTTDLTALLIGVGLALVQFALGPIIMDISLSWFYNLSWVWPDDLPAYLRTFIARVAEEKKIKFPRMGIIEDGAPNAFTTTGCWSRLSAWAAPSRPGSPIEATTSPS